MKCFHEQSRAARQQGSILIVVVVTLLIAATALTLFIEKAADDLLVESRDIEARRLRMEAYSALETTLAVLHEFRLVNGNLHSPSEGWSEPLAWAGYEASEGRTVQVEFLDESGKLSLPKVSPTVLVALFKSWDIRPSEAERLTDALLDWCQPDYVASSGFTSSYEMDKLPFFSPGRSLRSFSELQSIDVIRETFFDKDTGRPNELWRRFTEAVSLLNFSQSNLNAAQPGVLASLGVDPSSFGSLEDFRAGRKGSTGPGYFRSMVDAGTQLGINAVDGVGVEIKALRIVLTVREGRAVFRLNTVVAVSGSGNAKAVTQKAIARNEDGSPKTETKSVQQQKANAQARTKQASGTGLNYPFTILEILENDAMPLPPPAPPDKA